MISSTMARPPAARAQSLSLCGSTPSLITPLTKLAFCFCNQRGRDRRPLRAHASAVQACSRCALDAVYKRGGQASFRRCSSTLSSTLSTQIQLCSGTCLSSGWKLGHAYLADVRNLLLKRSGNVEKLERATFAPRTRRKGSRRRSPAWCRSFRARSSACSVVLGPAP